MQDKEVEYALDTDKACVQVRVAGDLISTKENAFRDLLQKLDANLNVARGRYPLIEVDARSIRFIDSVGLNCLVSLLRIAVQRQSRVTLLVGNSNTNRVIEASGLHRLMRVVMQAPAAG